ncbi:hypothetical protein GQR58_018620 [Nymphon striatum]|nr:hypothetical protein GQR58_018620 [Nymphon striatum]
MEVIDRLRRKKVFPENKCHSDNSEIPQEKLSNLSSEKSLNSTSSNANLENELNYEIDSINCRKGESGQKFYVKNINLDNSGLENSENGTISFHENIEADTRHPTNFVPVDSNIATAFIKNRNENDSHEKMSVHDDNGCGNQSSLPHTMNHSKVPESEKMCINSYCDSSFGNRSENQPNILNPTNNQYIIPMSLPELCQLPGLGEITENHASNGSHLGSGTKDHLNVLYQNCNQNFVPVNSNIATAFIKNRNENDSYEKMSVHDDNECHQPANCFQNSYLKYLDREINIENELKQRKNYSKFIAESQASAATGTLTDDLFNTHYNIPKKPYFNRPEGKVDNRLMISNEFSNVRTLTEQNAIHIAKTKIRKLGNDDVKSSVIMDHCSESDEKIQKSQAKDKENSISNLHTKATTQQRINYNDQIKKKCLPVQSIYSGHLKKDHTHCFKCKNSRAVSQKRSQNKRNVHEKSKKNERLEPKIPQQICQSLRFVKGYFEDFEEQTQSRTRQQCYGLHKHQPHISLRYQNMKP